MKTLASLVLYLMVASVLIHPLWLTLVLICAASYIVAYDERYATDTDKEVAKVTANIFVIAIIFVIIHIIYGITTGNSLMSLLK